MKQTILQFFDSVFGRIILSMFTAVLLYFALMIEGGPIRFLLACTAYVPFFWAIYKQPKGRAAFYGLILGFSHGLLLFWVFLNIATVFSGSVMWGIVSQIGLAMVISLFSALFAFVFAWLKVSDWKQNWAKLLIGAALWTGIDFLIVWFFPAIPWAQNFFGNTLSFYPNFIQFANIAGVYGITFFLILINFALSMAIQSQKLKPALWVIGSLAFLLVYGSVYLAFQDKSDDGKEIRISIIHENIPIDVKWDETIPDSAINRYFIDLAAKATKENPDLILWSETAFRWDIAENDALLEEILRITWPTKAGHLIGIWTPIENEPKMNYNSAYYIEPDGLITGRYDKMHPMSFIEAPCFNPEDPDGFVIPFTNNDYSRVKPSRRNTLVLTPMGEIGVAICNETSFPDRAQTWTSMGAKFLVFMNNDSWFVDSPVNLWVHYSSAIFRAVENGRDAAIASNGGIAGMVKSSGKIVKSSLTVEPEVVSGYIQSRSNMTFYTLHGDLFSKLCLCALLIAVVIRAWRGLR